MLIRIFRELSRVLACQDLKETTFLRTFQAFLARPRLMEKEVFLQVLALHQNVTAPPYKEAFCVCVQFTSLGHLKI